MSTPIPRHKGQALVIGFWERVVIIYGTDDMTGVIVRRPHRTWSHITVIAPTGSYILL